MAINFAFITVKLYQTDLKAGNIMTISEKLKLNKYYKQLKRIKSVLQYYIPNYADVADPKSVKKDVDQLHIDAFLAIDPHASLNKKEESNKENTDPIQDKHCSFSPVDLLWTDIIASVYLNTGKKMYDEQIIASECLSDKHIIEMKTGEGKTLSGIATVIYLLMTKKVKNCFVITTNEYLATRDYQNSKPIYQRYNLSSAVIKEQDSEKQKQSKYKSKIIYLTDEQLGFDYLRDMNTVNKEHLLLPDLDFCLIDEVDNILLDNARTPLILSSDKTDNKYDFKLAQKFVNTLSPEDYTVKQEYYEVYLNNTGEGKLGSFKADYSQDIPDLPKFLISINISLRANFLMHKSIDYIVKDNRIILLNSDTGRLSRNRRYNDGMSNALEAKEDLPLTQEDRMSQRLTYQSLFNLFRSFSGMTGTAFVSHKEFKILYHKSVIRIPSHFKTNRVDYPDRLYISAEKRNMAVLQVIRKLHRQGIPILIQTTSLKENQAFSDFLTSNHVKHQTYTANTVADKSSDNYIREKNIVSTIGRNGMITVATNIAGRGTDIKLSGDVSEFVVLGISRSRNRRLDEQFIGRSGRQGESGISQFFLSLDDPLIHDFARQGLIQNINRLKIKQNNHLNSTGLISGKLNRIIRQAEKTAADIDLTQRQNLSEYNQVNETVREKIYRLHDLMLHNAPDQNSALMKSLCLTHLPELNTEDIVLKHQLILILNQNKGVYLTERATTAEIMNICQELIIDKFKSFDSSDNNSDITKLQEKFLSDLNFQWSRLLQQFTVDEYKTALSNYQGIDNISAYAHLVSKQEKDIMRQVWVELIYEVLLG